MPCTTHSDVLHYESAMISTTASLAAYVSSTRTRSTHSNARVREHEMARSSSSTSRSNSNAGLLFLPATRSSLSPLTTPKGEASHASRANWKPAPDCSTLRRRAV